MQRQSASSRHEFWRAALARQGRSGLSIHQFCVKEGLAAATFFAWKRRLSQEAGGGAGGAPGVGFAPVRVVAEDTLPTAHDGIEILLPGARCVRITGAVDRQQLAAVLAVLEA